MIVIGLLGRAGSGKSTAAKYLAEKYGAKIFSFAKPLKELAKELFDFADAQVYGSQDEKEAVDLRYGFSPRTAMIRLGEGVRAVLGVDTWIVACLRQINLYAAIHRTKDFDPLCVIEDVRYPNEAMEISRHGRILKLVCPDSVSSAYTNAPSEKSVDECAPEYIYKTIVSHRSPESKDLKAKIDEVMREIFK